MSTEASSSPCSGRSRTPTWASRTSSRRRRLLLRRQRSRHRHLHALPPQFIGGTNADTGNSGASPRSPAPRRGRGIRRSRTAAGPTRCGARSRARRRSTDPTFDNSVVGEQVDNAGGVEWDQYATGAGLPNDGSQRSSRSSPAALCHRSCRSTRRTRARCRACRSTSPSAPSTPTGRRTRAGRFAIRSSAPTPAPQRDGGRRWQRGHHTHRGARVGADTVVAFLDFNNNGTREVAEPQASAPATFVDNVTRGAPWRSPATGRAAAAARASRCSSRSTATRRRPSPFRRRSSPAAAAPAPRQSTRRSPRSRSR